mgnify:CR=1 FL=1|jgi:Ca2+-binding EF-hand superfamily protein|tara:strand:- start:7665 stop:8471 length:807 start_codon:yes stop_codon:yes gene_type:complete
MEIKKGSLYQKGKHGEVYKVLDITSGTINGFKREEVVIGNLNTNEATSVSLSEIQDGRVWKSCGQQVQRIIVEKQIIQTSDGNVITLRETVIDGKAKHEKLKEMPKVDENIKRAIQQRTPDGNVGQALASAVETTKTVNIQSINNVHTNGEVKAEELIQSLDNLQKQKPDHRKFAFIKYDQLDILGEVFGSHPDIIKQCSGKFKKGLAVLHQQCLDRFRDGNISIAELRDYCPHYVTGQNLSLEGTIMRLNKAIWHYGTEKERANYGW